MDDVCENCGAGIDYCSNTDGDWCPCCTEQCCDGCTHLGGED